MKCCEKKENIELIKEYDPQPKNKDGSIRWFFPGGVHGLPY